MFDQELSMKVVLLVVSAFAIVSWAAFKLLNPKPVSVDELGAIDMNDQRRRDLIEIDDKRWK